jgi:hypothetical protein
MTEEINQEIIKYISKRIDKFKNDVIKLSLENNHPYIDAILRYAIIDFKLHIKDCAADIQPESEEARICGIIL